MISDTELDALIDAEAKATKGVWIADTKLDGDAVTLIADIYGTELAETDNDGDGESFKNFRFIARIRNAAPSILAELRASRELIAKLPRTADGAPIIPGVDRVWIRPGDSGGFCHNEHCFDEASQPIEVRIGAWHGDHFWIDGKTSALAEGDYWFGKCYSTREAALAAQVKP